MNKLFQNASIGFKIILISALFAAIFLGVSFSYVVLHVRSMLIAEAIKSLQSDLQSEKEKVEIYADQVKGIVLALKGTPPVQGIIRARTNGGIDRLDNSTLVQWQNRLQAIFSAEMAASGIYDQLRFIDKDGREVVRVNLVDGKPHAVPESELQYKGDRDYFLETRALSDDSVYVSHTQLNREGNPPTVSVPYKPVVRYSSPVFQKQTGTWSGVLVANVLTDRLIRKNSVLGSRFDLYVADAEGYFVVHPDTTKEWGGPDDLGTGFNLRGEFPGASFDGQSGVIYEGDDVLAYVRVQFDKNDPSRDWIVLERVPSSVIFGSINSTVASAIFVGFATFVLLFFIFRFAIRRLLSPLQDLAVGTDRIGTGDFDTEVPITSQDEIGRVAEAFNRMADKLKVLYSSLEDQVHEKTKNLDDKVTDLEKTQRAMTNVLEDIEAEKERAKAMLASIGDGLIVLDKDERILLVNKSFEALLGWKESEVRGKKLTQVVPMLDASGTLVSEESRLITKTLKEKKKETTQDRSVQYRRKDGSHFPVAITVSPILSDEQVAGAVEVFRDITKETEVDKAKTEFVSLASHQLRTPLTSINWYTEILLGGDAGEVNEEQKRYLHEIYDGGKRMVELVNALLNVSRIELGTFIVEPKATDVVALLASVVDEQKTAIEQRHISVSVDTREWSTLYNADPKLLRMIFQNLLSNAVKYTPPGGSIQITVAGKVKGQTYGTVTLAEDSFCFSITDSGYGIPANQKDKIFTKLFRADNVRTMDTDGTGLGLYIVKSIVDHSGGHIWFVSEEHKGTTFFFILPNAGMVRQEGSRALGS